MTIAVSATTPGTRLIDPQLLRDLLAGDGEIAVLDVREEGQFGEGHLFHAINAPYSRLELDVPALAPRRSARVVLLDDGDGVAARAAHRLAAIGYGDVSVLAGGVPAWVAAGYEVYKSTNSRFKAFAEVVEHAFHTPAIDAQDLARLKAEGADLVVLDSRTPEEFARFHVPGAISCPGADLVLNFDRFVTSPEQRVVISCAGRTRGIIGAQSLIDAGVPNRVQVLKGGTQGWRLAGLELASGADARAPAEPAPQAQARAEAVRVRYGVPLVETPTLAAWLGAERDHRTTFLFDLRDTPARAARPVPGAIAAPGGQLVQALDRWVGVQRARIVLFDDDGVRARLTAHWLIQIGEDVHVHDGVPALPQPVPGEGQAPALEQVSPIEAAALLTEGGRALSLDASAAFRTEHAAGALWTIRPRLSALPQEVTSAPVIVLFAQDPAVAALAAVDLREVSKARIVSVAGGVSAWREAGLPVEASPSVPPDTARIDYLFWAHDRHDGNPQAMHTYLGWEEQLPAQIAAEIAGGGFRLVR
ncbi:transferase [Azorhizobium oxalatiphilum]|uniref:Transferase n=1 Tax=Azorhizobium oxalatiphilum TaxID=980631 RepID=A0A917FAS4_9HYPH|nr:rhodanese-like domain-containing protein [Azorhizobium oxalatiphilum]GGF58328.1 transferase [Azorhizobium oxalatiphilum]